MLCLVMPNVQGRGNSFFIRLVPMGKRLAKRRNCVSTQFIVQHCAPTLAGLKVGNLFSYKFKSLHALKRAIEKRNGQLGVKGICFTVLRIKGNVALIYVYRKSALHALLQVPAIQAFLHSFGFVQFDVETCLHVLSSHLTGQCFPHEIGVFLGYPLHDVIAFIQNKGKGCKCSGCWKVYGNVSNAQKTFDRYAKCRCVFMQKVEAGYDIFHLTVVC